MINIPQEELFRQFRAVIFSGAEFTEGIIKRYSGQYKGVDIPQAIDKARMQMEPASLPDIGFDKIVKLHQSRTRIRSLLDSHPDYLLNEYAGHEDQRPFDWLSAAFEKDKPDRDRITLYVKYLEDRARKQETKDTKDRLFETVRDFAQWCKEFLLNPKYEPLYPVLSQYYEEVVSKIAGNVSKIGINIIAYRDLAEECYSSINGSVQKEKAFQYILALINLRCKGLGVSIPSVNTVVVCPGCGDKEQSGNICTKCGAYIKCPGCNHILGKDAKMCGGCGIEVDRIESWLGRIKDADKKISAGDYEAAEELIRDLKTRWAKNEQVISILNTIAGLREKVIDCEKIIDGCIAKRNYFAAQRHFEEIKRNIVLPAGIRVKEKNILEKIEKAGLLVSEGDKQAVPADKTDYYAQAVFLAADFDEALSKLKHQNIRVTGLTGKAGGKQMQLSWNRIGFDTLSLTYIICREDITNQKAKTEIARSSATTYTETIEGGVSYIYSVQVEYRINGTDITGIWDAVKSQEILVPDDISDYKVAAGDKNVRIEFTPHPHAADYELYRCEESGTKEILRANLRDGSYTDTRVKNDVHYTYTLITLFKKSSGEIIRSQGVEIYAVPLVPPEPVQSADVFKEGGIATLSWKGNGKSQDSFRILHSVTPVNKPVGFSMLLSELERAGNVSIPLTPSKTECKLFEHAVKNYFSIWSVFGDLVIAGTEVEVLNITEVSNAKCYLSFGKLYVEWDWPSNCKQVRISYSNESYTDPHKIIKNYPRELYDRQRAFVIESVTDKDYFIEIATQNFEGKQELLSSGVRIKFANKPPMIIKYTLKVSTFLRKKLSLTIENDNNDRLPELVLISSAGKMPVRKEDGTAIHLIPEGTACGTYELSGEHIRKNYYARLFLTDASIKNIKIITPGKERLKLF